MIDTPKAILGEQARQIIKDVPTVMKFGNTTLQLNRAFAYGFESASRNLQMMSEKPYHLPLPATQNIELLGLTPQLPIFLYCLTTPPALNTEMQTFLAQSTGILEEGETWTDFLRRPTIVTVDSWKDFNAYDTDNEVIPGMRYGLPTKKGWKVQHMGQPYYLRAGTKYLGVQSIVRFQTMGHTNEPLDHLVERGATTLHLTLKVPSSEFMPSVKE